MPIRQGHFGQVITVVNAPRGQVPMLKRFKVLRLNLKSKTLHTQWTANDPDLEDTLQGFVE